MDAQPSSRERQAFHTTPSYETALAYMDAALARWEGSFIDALVTGDIGGSALATHQKRTPAESDFELKAAMDEVRGWLTIR